MKLKKKPFDGLLFERRRHGTLINQTTKCIFQRSLFVCLCSLRVHDIARRLFSFIAAGFSPFGFFKIVRFQSLLCICIVLSLVYIWPPCLSSFSYYEHFHILRSDVILHERIDLCMCVVWVRAPFACSFTN